MTQAVLSLLISMILTVLLGFRSVSAAVEIVTLRHRLPVELTRMLSSLLEPGETVVPVPAGLAIKARPDRIEAIRELVQRLDRPLRHLVLTVLQTDRLTLEEPEAGLQGHLPQEPIRAYGHRYGSRSMRDRTVRQQLRVLEGQPAYLVVGQERPVPVIRLYGFPPQAVGGIEYQPVTTGFQVRAHLLDCHIRLTISPWSKRLRAAGDESRSLRTMETTVVVKPGQWVELGSHADAEAGAVRSPQSAYRYRTRHGRQRVFLRAEIADGCQRCR